MDDPRILVSSLNICNGVDVEIGREVYETVAPFLDELKVVERGGIAVERLKEQQQDNKTAAPVDTLTENEEEEEMIEAQNTLMMTTQDEPELSFDAAQDDGNDAGDEEELEEEEEHTDENERSSDHWEHVVSAPSVKKEPSPRVQKIKREPTDITHEPVTGITTQAKALTDERFKVYISGPLPGQMAEFMTRGGHLVRKVLSGACKTFGLDPHGARLMVIISADGLEEEHRFECENEETMARAGVEPGMHLVIETMDEEDDLE
ncbi:hypothetical protein C8J56DRAFT_969502 [Mycena floridula]|nr:hypothetical protein C8J56DRAFT_969502 [Mycena floridula]